MSYLGVLCLRKWTVLMAAKLRKRRRIDRIPAHSPCRGTSRHLIVEASAPIDQPFSECKGGIPSEDRAPRTIPAVVDEDDDTGDNLDIFMMDNEIMKNKSQQKKSSVVSDVEISAKDTPKEENEHLLHLRQWIKNATYPTAAKLLIHYRRCSLGNLQRWVELKSLV